MAEDELAGPALRISTGSGTEVPLYLISFNKEGECIAPRTRAAVLAAASGAQFTDVHLYCHGWNNVFAQAVEHYTGFFTEYFGLSGSAGLDSAAYKPLLVGLIWPSTALLARGEETPQLAAPGKGPWAADIAEVGAEMEPDAAAQLAALAGAAKPLAGADARALAALLAPVLRAHGGANDEGPNPSAALDADALLQAWGTPAPSPGARPGAPGRLPLPGEAAPAALEAAARLGFPDPREAIRMASVYIMKDRAGRVGRTGVAGLVRDAVASGKRVHLTGHSYGTRVLLSALSQLPAPQRVSSVLLLQPAVSAYCFAKQIREHGDRPGGYRQVLDRTVLPLSTTFSRYDRALAGFYPLALRRARDRGEIEAGAAVSPYAALGAVGPQGMAQGETDTLTLLDAPAPYAPPLASVRVRALDGASGIRRHGDVCNRYTGWALASLVRQGALS